MRRITMEDEVSVEIHHRRGVVRHRGRFLGTINRCQGAWTDGARRYASPQEAAECLAGVR